MKTMSYVWTNYIPGKKKGLQYEIKWQYWTLFIRFVHIKQYQNENISCCTIIKYLIQCLILQIRININLKLGVRRDPKYGPRSQWDENLTNVGYPRYTCKCIKRQGKFHLTTQNDIYPNILSIIVNKYGHFLLKRVSLHVGRK